MAHHYDTLEKTTCCITMKTIEEMRGDKMQNILYLLHCVLYITKHCKKPTNQKKKALSIFLTTVKPDVKSSRGKH